MTNTAAVMIAGIFLFVGIVSMILCADGILHQDRHALDWAMLTAATFALAYIVHTLWTGVCP